MNNLLYQIYFFDLSGIVTPYLNCPIDIEVILPSNKASIQLGFKFPEPYTNMKNVNASHAKDYSFPVGRTTVFFHAFDVEGQQRSCVVLIHVLGKFEHHRCKRMNNTSRPSLLGSVFGSKQVGVKNKQHHQARTQFGRGCTHGPTSTRHCPQFLVITPNSAPLFPLQSLRLLSQLPRGLPLPLCPSIPPSTTALVNPSALIMCPKNWC